MKRNVRNICLQSTLRQRVRTLFLLVLVGLISFAFISRAVEYLVVDRETDRLAGYYRAIGILEPVNPTYVSSLTWNALIELQEKSGNNKIGEGAGLVSKSQYVTLEDQRRSCSGVLQGLYNADIEGSAYYYPREVLFYGKLSDKSNMYIEYQFFLEVDQVLAGYPEYLQEGSSIRLRYRAENPGDLDAIYDSLQVGERYFIKAYYDAVSSRLTWQKASENLFLSPLNDSGLWFLPVEPGDSVDLMDPVLAELAEELQVLEENLHAMWVIGTKDMSAIPYLQESSRQYYLTEGRWLNREDDLRGNRVCVVHRDFAELRGLSVGDTLTLKLRDLKTPFNGYIFPGGDWGAWQNYETHMEEFEIVGLYGRLDIPYSYVTTRMYIPDSCIPAGYGDDWWHWYICSLNSSYYSFILSSPGDTEAFLAENQEALTELGLQVTILDTGWENFRASAVPMKRSAAMSAGVFSLVLVLALGLAAFLYLRQRRRDFAILRSLGVPKRAAIRQMLEPMALVGAVSILMGGFVAWFYALGKASGTLASLQGPESAIPSAALSPAWLAGLCSVAFALLLLFTAVGTVMTARSPVLELLQGTARQVGGKRKSEGAVPEGQKAGAQEMHSAPARAISLGEAPAPARKPGFAQVPRYVLRHSRRAPLKSILTVAVALCFTLALGWMSWTMERNEVELDRLYRTTPVEAMIIQTSSSSYYSGGFIRCRTVDTILMSGFVQSAYLEGAARPPRVAAMGEGGVEDSERTEKVVALRAFDRPEQFFSNNGRDILVEYAEGWDESLFTQDWTEEQVRPVLLPADIMERLRLQPGEVVLIPNKTFTVESFIVAGQYTGLVHGRDRGNPILLPLSALEQLEGDKMLYIAAEFVLDPAKNRELPEFRARMESLFKTDVGTVPLTFLFWDEELTDVVEPLERNLSLMEILFPVTVAVSVLIAAGLAALLMFQAAREASIMRVLGTTKGRARAMLYGEQLFLCLLGLVLGLALLIVLRQDAAAVLTGSALICAALYLTGVICGSIPSAVSVTNRMPLELLQVKE